MDTEESAEETEESTYSTTEETKEPENRRPKFILKIITFIGGLQLLLGEILNTAGKVVVTILLGLAGRDFSETPKFSMNQCSGFGFVHTSGELLIRREISLLF